jgi:hypothetical protein
MISFTVYVGSYVNARQEKGGYDIFTPRRIPMPVKIIFAGENGFEICVGRL